MFKRVTTKGHIYLDYLVVQVVHFEDKVGSGNNT